MLINRNCRICIKTDFTTKFFRLANTFSLLRSVGSLTSATLLPERATVGEASVSVSALCFTPFSTLLHTQLPALPIGNSSVPISLLHKGRTSTHKALFLRETMALSVNGVQ